MLDDSKMRTGSVGMVAIFERYVTPSLQALREGMIWLIPCLMISSFVLFVACIGEFVYGYRTGVVSLFYNVHGAIARYFPLLMTATISYVMAMQWRLPRPPIALISIVLLLIVGEVLPGEQTVLTFNIIMAIITPLYAVPFIAFFLKFDALKLTRSESAGQLVKESLNMVFPAIITTAIVLVVNYTIFASLSSVSFLNWLTVDYANEPTLFGMMFAALNSILWFLGIHGYYALLPLVDLLQEASNLNYSTMLAGGAGQYHMNLSFMGAFVFIGGSGATLSLVLALLIFSKQRSLRMIAIASIPIGMINVNEILLFGLPIIFNPRLFLPFLLAPMVNVVTAMFAVSLGLVASPSVAVPFNSPILINAWMATGGDWGAVMLQIVNVIIGVLIYLPSVKLINRSAEKKEIRLSALDTIYTRREEEAKILLDDPIAQSLQKEKETRQIEQELEMLSHIDFCLEYQPQVSPITGRAVGCEALIRARNGNGELKYPGSFMPWLEKADLMKDVDLWVFRNVVRDIRKLHSKGIYIPVSINITPETLTSPTHFQQLEKVIAPYAKYIHLEITEETLLFDEKQLTYAFNRLHLMGAKIYIDDFGTGYSSLSYLNQFNIDAIKIDRAFVLALATDKGEKVFNSVLSVADELSLSVVIEGVETEEQLGFVPRSEHVSVQGWYYARSLDIDKLAEFIGH